MFSSRVCRRCPSSQSRCGNSRGHAGPFRPFPVPALCLWLGRLAWLCPALPRESVRKWCQASAPAAPAAPAPAAPPANHQYCGGRANQCGRESLNDSSRGKKAAAFPYKVMAAKLKLDEWKGEEDVRLYNQEAGVGVVGEEFPVRKGHNDQAGQGGRGRRQGREERRVPEMK